ncbi:MAG TPA: beta-glucuronidase [Spirochaetota bacterium]|nr:beta-glucuronidase [Spirochaetota bacterium]
MLYPRESFTREIRKLDGIWNFKADKKGTGLKQKWHQRPLKKSIKMPVPSSFNDITQDASLRDFCGDVWYETSTFIPAAWSGENVSIRCGSATHWAEVYINGSSAGTHKGGFLPFEFKINKYIKWGQSNRITIRVNNILTWQTLQPGETVTRNGPGYPPGYKTLDYHFDFFNYAGLHRPVMLYVRPRRHITDITVQTDIRGKTGLITYGIQTNTRHSRLQVTVKDARDRLKYSDGSLKGKAEIKNAVLWQPGKAYLYKLQADLLDEQGEICDTYTLPVGIRTAAVKNNKFLINGRPFYFKGFGKHEDIDIRGRGLDPAHHVKDFNLLKWINANSFRTSHYPYAEEIMNLADEYGIVIIDEAPAVGLYLGFGEDNRTAFCPQRLNKKATANHLRIMRALIERDKNHPSVVMWSVANEAATHEKGAVPHFRRVFDLTRKLDPTRPVTLVNHTSPQYCRVSQMADVLCYNKYYGWYTDVGYPEVINRQLSRLINSAWKKFKKPVMFTEYGGDTVAGLHSSPPRLFSEEYQCKMLSEFHKVFDRFSCFIGEQVWNFADFATKQGPVRIIGNKKGVFTRDRHPKMAAHMLRERWQHKKAE